jgi:hypothetical protein
VQTRSLQTRAGALEKEDMKPRLAAVVLAGWYLMLPPLSRDARRVVSGAPQSRWVIDSAYDSAAECEAARVHKVSEAWESLKQAGSNPANDLLVKDAAFAQCIAADDARLVK